MNVLGFQDITDWQQHMLYSRSHVVSSSMHMMRSCACITCNLGFTHAEALHKHLLSAHARDDISTVRVEYRCLFCPAAFSDAEVLYRHTEEHEKEYTVRHGGSIGSNRTRLDSVKPAGYIETAVPDTTCQEDRKSASGENSSSTESPGSNQEDETAVGQKYTHRRYLNASNSAPITNAISSSNCQQPIGRKHGGSKSHGDYRPSRMEPGNSAIRFDSIKRTSQDEQFLASEDRRIDRDSHSVGLEEGNVHRAPSSDTQARYNSPAARNKSNLQQKVNDIIESVMTSSNSPNAVERNKSYENSKDIRRYSGEAARVNSGNFKMQNERDGSPLENSQTKPRTDSVRYFIESLVAAEVKRNSVHTPTPSNSAKESVASLSSDRAWPNRSGSQHSGDSRSADCPSPSNNLRQFSRVPEQQFTSTRVGERDLRGNLAGNNNNSLPCMDNFGRNPTTAQLLLEARSLKMMSSNDASSPRDNLQRSGLQVRSDSAQIITPRSNDLSPSSPPPPPLLRRSFASESFETATGKPHTGSTATNVVGISETTTPLLRDIVSLMNQAVVNNIRGYADTPIASPAGVGTEMIVSSPAASGRCVRDVCDAIIAQSFKEDGKPKQTSDHSGNNHAAASNNANYSLSRPFRRIGSSSRHSSVSAGSTTSVDSENQLTMMSTVDEELRRSSFAEKKNIVSSKVVTVSVNESKQVGEPRNAGAKPTKVGISSGGLTLKEVMDNPAIARTHHFQGFGRGGNSNTTSSVRDRISFDGPHPKRRKSEECPSLEEFFASSAGSLERRRNQTFSAGNSISLEKLLASDSANSKKRRDSIKFDNGIREIDKFDVKVNVLTDEKVPPVQTGTGDASKNEDAIAKDSERDKFLPLSENSSSSDEDSNAGYFGRKRKLVIDETALEPNQEDVPTKLLSLSAEKGVPSIAKENQEGIGLQAFESKTAAKAPSI